ncbi:MAG: hypothetical protein ACI4VW_02185 [Acutalibacteraceae bacterium]
MSVKHFYALFRCVFFLFTHIIVTVNIPQQINSIGIKIFELLSLPVCGDLESASIITDDAGFSSGASMCATISIPSSVCNAKALMGVNKAIKNTEISIKHK